MMKPTKIQDAAPADAHFGAQKLRSLFGTTRPEDHGPLVSTVRSLTQVINDLTKDNQYLREQVQELTEGYERAMILIMRLSGVPSEVLGDAIPDEEIAATKKAAAETAAALKKNGA